MSDLRRRFRHRLQAKVMVAVLAVLLVLPAVTLWIVDRELARQTRLDAELALRMARASFEQSLRMRTDDLAVRFRSGLYDQRFLKILELNDAPTMQGYLQRDVLEEYNDETELAIFVAAKGSVFAAARHGGPVAVRFDAFASAAEVVVRSALGGEVGTGIVSVGENVYNVVALPVTPPGRGVVGALVFGLRIGDVTLARIKPPSAEILIVNGSRVAASTVKDSEENQAVLDQLAQPGITLNRGYLTLGGERFLPVTGSLDPSTSKLGFRYVLLSSCERRLAALERTQVTLLAVTLLGIVVGAAVVWFFVRRITSPLLELRDRAEAVGRGDFSQRIGRFSNDECGDLAQAFNGMTANLQTSRAELERAMQQVKTTQEQLIQSEKLSAVGQFVAGVAHELNNPLTAVVGFSELLQGLPGDAKTHDFLDKIAKSAHRCHKIVQSLLSFARQHAPERRLVMLHKIVDEVLEIMAYDLRTSNVTVLREFAPEVPLVLGDAHQLQQVFINIIGNARQAMELVQREGQIVIRTRPVGSRVTIDFEDNGPGIRPEHLARIFDPFFTTKPVGKGTGLGLSLCYGIVKEHGGTITARSEVGHGATFSIELPVSAATAVPATGGDVAVVPVLRPAIVASGKTVLVIDDEEWILELAAEVLRGEGHAVETAVGGQQALERLSGRKYDVIVSDWKMPGLSGVKLYEHLCATDPESAKRVLFMTGDVVNDTFQDFLRKNELACLSKPFATREFRAAVAKVFARS